MLAEYLDRKLDPTRRATIEDHASRCEDCYFSVMETALMSEEMGAEGLGLGGYEAPVYGAVADVAAVNASASSKAPGTVPAGPRAWFSTRYLLPMAATLTVISGSIALWKQAHPTEAYSVAIQPLVEAVGEHRFFEPRLAGGFRYGPKVEARRAAEGGPTSGAWAALGVAKEMRSRDVPASNGTQAARAAAAAFLGQVDQAVIEYSELVAVESENADWACNLAAVLLLRASMAPPTASADRIEALRYANQAIRLNPGLVEAHFNRGLALEALGRAQDAQNAFAEIAARRDTWSEAAREHLPNLGVGPGGRN